MTNKKMLEILNRVQFEFGRLYDRYGGKNWQTEVPNEDLWSEIIDYIQELEKTPKEVKND